MGIIRSLEGQQVCRYRFERLLGSGGMGAVYLATDPLIKRQVAIKVMRTEDPLYRDPSTAKDAARSKRRAARAIATLDHPVLAPSTIRS